VWADICTRALSIDPQKSSQGSGEQAIKDQLKAKTDESDARAGRLANQSSSDKTDMYSQGTGCR